MIKCNIEIKRSYIFITFSSIFKKKGSFHLVFLKLFILFLLFYFKFDNTKVGALHKACFAKTEEDLSKRDFSKWEVGSTKLEIAVSTLSANSNDTT